MSRTINDKELIRLYDEMALIYPKLRKPDSAQAAEQLRLIYVGFTYQELRDAFLVYSRKERYAPQPADLLDEARAARHQSYMENSAERLPTFDTNGERTYICRYCRDTGYMPIYLPDDQHRTLMAACVHTKPGAAAKLKRLGRFRFRLPRHDIDEVLVWNPQERAFQSESSFVPEWSAERKEADVILTEALDLFGGKV